MKKIVIYKTKWDRNINHFHNSLIGKIKNNYFFFSYFKESEEKIIYEEKIIQFNEELVSKLVFLLQEAKKLAKSLSTEFMGNEKEENSIIGGIYSTVYKYANFSKISIFDFINELFIKILKTHYLYNGNKRLAISFLYLLCWELGYYFYWSSKRWLFYNKHETKLKGFAERLKNNNDISKEIKEWIENNIVIGLNWR